MLIAFSFDYDASSPPSRDEGRKGSKGCFKSLKSEYRSSPWKSPGVLFRSRLVSAEKNGKKPHPSLLTLFAKLCLIYFWQAKGKDGFFFPASLSWKWWKKTSAPLWFPRRFSLCYSLRYRYRGNTYLNTYLFLCFKTPMGFWIWSLEVFVLRRWKNRLLTANAF